jgi:hypothetical protein
MRSRLAPKAMPLHHPSKPASFGSTRDINIAELPKNIPGNLLTFLDDLKGLRVHMKLAKPTFWCHPNPLKVALERFCSAFHLFIPKAKLDSRIPVTLCGLLLYHPTRTSLNSGHRNNVP